MISKEMESRIDKFIEENRQNIVNDIAKLVNIKSVSTHSDDPNSPFGEGCHKVLDKALEMCEAMGFKTRNYDYYAGSAVFGSGDKEIARKKAPIFAPGEMVELTLKPEVVAALDGSDITVTMERS